MDEKERNERDASTPLGRRRKKMKERAKKSIHTPFSVLKSYSLRSIL